MQALQKRHIKPGDRYNKLFPKSHRQDIVIKGAGKGKLHHTINLIRDLVWETREDTKLLAKLLEGKNLEETCRNTWEFVYGHINYRRDKPGIEQVRRPSRTWADRKKGVDCDCYTVFISSILTNLGIPHSIRITKYNGKRYFQHIYPIVHSNGKLNEEPLTSGHIINDGWQMKPGYITIDCVTDHFDYEVPFSDYLDFDMQSRKPVGEIHGLPIIAVSGVDSADLIGDLGIFSLEQPSLPLREIIKRGSETPNGDNRPPCRLVIKTVPKEEAPNLSISKLSTPAGESNESDQSEHPGTSLEHIRQTGQSGNNLWIKLLLAAGIGYGAYKLFEFGPDNYREKH